MSYKTHIRYGAKTTTYSITNADDFVNCMGTFTTTLPTAVGCAGQRFTVANQATRVTTGSGPNGISINAAGTYAYVANYTANTVSKIQLSDNTVTNTLALAAAGPARLVLNTAGTKLYVACYTTGAVKVVDVAGFTVSATIAVGTGPSGIAITPDDSTVYVSNNTAGTVSKIQTSDDTVAATITVGTAPYGVTVNAAGTFAYVCNTTTGTVSKINTSTDVVDATITGMAAARAIVINPAGTFAYVTTTTTTFYKVDLGADTTGASVATLPTNNSSVAIDPAGTYAYIPNVSGSATSAVLTVVRLSDNVVMTNLIALGASAVAIQINAAGTYAYVASYAGTWISVLRLSDWATHGTITVARTSSQTIDNVASNVTINGIGKITFTSDGANWIAEGDYSNETVGRRLFTWSSALGGWQMTYNDTGVRDVAAGLLVNSWTGTATLRRCGNIIRLTLAVTNSSSSATILTVPTGFRPPATVRELGDDGSALVMVTVTTGAVAPTAAKTAVNLYTEWSTTDAWPTVLPGTASGSIPSA